MDEMKMSGEKNKLSYNMTFSLDHHSTFSIKSLYLWVYE
jgi:hypothetical protein